MKHIKLFEDFLNESTEKVRLYRFYQGRLKEKIEGTIWDIVDRYWDIDNFLDSWKGKNFTNKPKTVEELIDLLNNVQAWKEKKSVGQTTHVFKHWKEVED